MFFSFLKLVKKVDLEIMPYFNFIWNEFQMSKKDALNVRFGFNSKLSY